MEASGLRPVSTLSCLVLAGPHFGACISGTTRSQ